MTASGGNPALGYDLNDEFELQPIDDDEQSHGERLLAKANARIELQQIHDDAPEGDLLTLEDSRLQFAIRHLLWLTTFTAIILTLGRRYGSLAALIGLLFSLLTWGWMYVLGRQRKHDKKIAHRLREFKRNHNQADLDGIDVNLKALDADNVWSLRNRK